MPRKHTLPPKRSSLKEALHAERHQFQEVEVPVLTVSATFRKEIADEYMIPVEGGADVIFSRAHYSMAEAIRGAAAGMKKSTYMADPTNFVAAEDWGKIAFTEEAGQLVARYPLLKWLKDKMDTVLRSKLPIADAIAEPLDYLAGKVKYPVISVHYEVGNQLMHKGKSVLQVVTDPHVRPEYLYSLPCECATFAVFDEETREEFLRKAMAQGKKVRNDQVVVTGPPVDVRITKLAAKKKTWRGKEPVHLAITTGGLGTNLLEIKEVLEQLKPLLKPPEQIRLFLYAGNHPDFRKLFEQFASENSVRVGNIDDVEARIRILYEDSIVDANENLIKYMFPWAHVVITKPSGDMAYDAVAAGCFLLLLEPWGPWEENIQKRMVKLGVAKDWNVSKALRQYKNWKSKGILSGMMKEVSKLPEIYREGAKEIVRLQGKLK